MDKRVTRKQTVQTQAVAQLEEAEVEAAVGEEHFHVKNMTTARYLIVASGQVLSQP